MTRALILLSFALTLACYTREMSPVLAKTSSGRTPTAASTIQNGTPEVNVWGALREMTHEGRIESRVDLATLLPGPHLYAVGALAGMRGEVTVFDGSAWIARGDHDGGRAVRGSGDEGATLLVVAKVDEWKTSSVAEDIPYSELDQRIESLATAAGVDLESPFPFIVEGQLANVKWHILRGPPSGLGAAHADHTGNAVVAERGLLTGLLVGFFSKHHQGVFTHMGQNIHAHILVTDEGIAGHADAVSIRAGSRVKFPR